MNINVKDKVCIVTGGSRGIGAVVVKKFVESEAKTVISFSAHIPEEKIEGVHYYAVNVTDRLIVKKTIDDIVENFGTIDVLVNNAGITRDALLLRMTEEQWDTVNNVNLKGVFNVTQAVAKPMLKQGTGSIITLSSIVGLYGNVGQTNYAATKGGDVAMTKTWAKELTLRKTSRIRANCVAPGFIRTQMVETIPAQNIESILAHTLLHRLGEAEDVANAVLFLASEASAFITGQTIVVDGGLSV